MRSNDTPSSSGTTNNKNIYSQPSPSTINVNVPQSNISVGVQPTHASVQHPVSLNMGMPPNGVVTYNNPPQPFVPPSTTQSQPGMLFYLNFIQYFLTKIKKTTIKLPKLTF